MISAARESHGLPGRVASLEAGVMEFAVEASLHR
jgi:hypothetical protein